ncbi:hypothetical protein ACFV08_01755 [Streptomyces fradiae]|uniref:hypothetical protein n=1 Tax=Streptomyces fradiae TaxID=1906 RepID=UPI00369E02BF
MFQSALVVPEKRGGFLIHSAQLVVREVQNASIHGEGAQMYINGHMRTANEIADVVDALRPHPLHRAQLVGLPQHWLQPQVVSGLENVADVAARRGVHLAVHTHANHVQSVTPLVAEAARALLDAGVRDVRNQGVLMREVNDSTAALLDLCFALQDEAGILPYYFYMCDMVPGAEHWRTSLAEAQDLQHAIMGYLPGYATPRIVCDVPYVGKRWVHQAVEYDRERGISYWTKNYRTGIELDDPDALTRRYPFYDPLSTLPESGWRWWERQVTAREGQACA